MRFYLYEGGVGDALALTATVREYHKARPREPIYVSTGGRYPDVFRNNPHVGKKPEGGQVAYLITEHNNERGNIAVSFGLQAGIEVVDSTPELFLDYEDRISFEHGFKLPWIEKPVIAVDPWSRCPARRWIWERWDEVVHELRLRYFVVGVGRRVADHVSGARDLRRLSLDLDYTGLLTLRQTAVLLERADIFLGMDSGGVHLAASVGCPSVALYSRSSPASRAYWNVTPVYNAGHPCNPQFCNRICMNPHGFCLDGIHPRSVLESVDLALRRFPRHASLQKAASRVGQAGRGPAPEGGDDRAGGAVAGSDNAVHSELGNDLRGTSSDCCVAD